MLFCGEKAWYTETDNSEFEEVVKMKDGKHPNPNTIHPIAGYDKEIYVKPTITNPNIIVGDFTYIADSDFESHVSHLYEWNDDKLIIGKFCQIAACKDGSAIKRRYRYRK